MTGRAVLLLMLAVAGIVAPFLIARRVLDAIYIPAVRGSAAPLGAQIGAYTIALLIALLVLYAASRLFRRLSRSASSATDLSTEEELPY